MSRLPALLATARIANLPGVVSNAWLGALLGGYLWRGTAQPLTGAEVAAALVLAAAAVLVYLSGSFLNDWADRGWDAAHRPERALPAGMFRPATFLAAAVLLAAAGVGLGFVADPGSGRACLLIAVLAAGYTLAHKRHPAALFALATCRGLLVVAGFLLVEPPAGLPGVHPQPDGGALPPQWAAWLPHAFVAAHALGVFAWTAGLSAIARFEALGRPPARPLAAAATALLCLPLAAMSCWWIPFHPLAATLALLPLAAWLALALTVFRAPLRRRVSALLAGFPLVDMAAALPLALALTPPGATPFAAPLLAAGLLVPAAAFALGRLLQRLASAT